MEMNDVGERATYCLVVASASADTRLAPFARYQVHVADVST